MEAHAPHVDGEEVVLKFRLRHPVGCNAALLPPPQPPSACQHLHLTLLPVCLAHPKFRIAVGLDLRDALGILSVVVHPQPQPVDTYLPVSGADAQRIQDLPLIGRPRLHGRGGEGLLPDAQLHAPPFPEGLRVPPAHDLGRVRGPDPAAAVVVVDHSRLTAFSMLPSLSNHPIMVAICLSLMPSCASRSRWERPPCSLLVISRSSRSFTA